MNGSKQLGRQGSIWLMVAALLVALPAVAVAQSGAQVLEDESKAAAALVQQVRAATARFQELDAAQAAGYALLHGCVSGPDHGAMGVHFVNGDLVGDGQVDAAHPEALIYEFKKGAPTLVGVEFVVLADQWNAAHAAPPVLGGQLFTYNTAPNRYGIPAFYALHVWAYRENPDGVFADWNRNVTCSGFTGGTPGADDLASHGS